MSYSPKISRVWNSEERLAKGKEASPKRRSSTLAQFLFGGGGGARETRVDKEAGYARPTVGDHPSSSATAHIALELRQQQQISNNKELSHHSKDLAVAADKKRKKSLVGLFTQQQEYRKAEEIAMRPKLMQVLVVGPKKVGKTTLLRTMTENVQVPSSSIVQDLQKYTPTLEDDTYHIQLHNGNPDARNPRELLLLHDTAGIPSFGNIELKRAHMQVADAFLLVFSVLESETFNRVDMLKKQIDREKLGTGKDKREVPIVVIGTKTDLPGRQVDSEFALHWANRERVKLFEVSALDRDTIVDIVHHLSGKFFNREAKFSLSRRLKPEKSNSIVMDF